LVTLTCAPADPVFVGLAAAFFGGSKGVLQVEAQGTVDGVTIQGTDTNTSVPVTFNWNFTAD
jgi:hypothetical protein